MTHYKDLVYSNTVFAQKLHIFFYNQNLQHQLQQLEEQDKLAKENKDTNIIINSNNNIKPLNKINMNENIKLPK